MNEYHAVINNGKITNGPYSPQEVNRFLSHPIPERHGKQNGLAISIVCEFIGLANKNPDRAYSLFIYLLGLLDEYFEAVGVPQPRWLQYEEKMIDYCNFAWNRLVIMARPNMPDVEEEKLSLMSSKVVP